MRRCSNEKLFKCITSQLQCANTQNEIFLNSYGWYYNLSMCKNSQHKKI